VNPHKMVNVAAVFKIDAYGMFGGKMLNMMLGIGRVISASFHKMVNQTTPQWPL